MGSVARTKAVGSILTSLDALGVVAFVALLLGCLVDHGPMAGHG